MGVPKFYRWLSERYPLINQMISNSSQLPEIDNFYLDMNAIDGCAPRAKLNQQRSRRFRAGQERSESMLKARQRGEAVDESSLFDSNCITPGTEFMEIIDTHLRWFIRKKIKDDPIWRDLEVIYSGHDVPGEGEHKIIQYIRDARATPGYQPNQRHCLYGQDADLIMLGLATHEPHFTLLREVIDFGGGKRFMGQRETVMKQTKDPKFQLLHLSVLREYIEADFASGHTGEPLDRERLVDDFVFLTFLVGNDFLPHLPTLDIGENAFDVIFGLYQDLQRTSVKYIVHNGEIGDFDRLEELFRAIGVREAEILRNREVEQKEFNAKRRKYKDRRQDIPSLEQEEAEEFEMQRALDLAIAEAEAEARGVHIEDGAEFKSGHTSAASSLPPTPPSTPSEGVVESGGWVDVASISKGLSRSIKESEQLEDSRVATKNYRGMYYYQKFKVTPGTARMDTFMAELTQEYLKGLMWCLSYYFRGCVSWSWYFPYYYGPMLYDMNNLREKAAQIVFDLGHPFQPFQQLLGCLPPSSKSLLPLPYQWIMTSPLSPVLEYYPNDFEVDMDGKKNPWEAVVILPFIDSDRLKAAEAEHCAPNTLTQPEIRRNTFGKILHYSFDPQCMDTVSSCNPAIGLLDIVHCQTRVRSLDVNLAPGQSFVPMLIPGTVKTCAGFPSLGLIPIAKVDLEAIKLNVFGSDSKYRSLVITVLGREFSPDTIDLAMLLNRSVFVNYPLLHEAKVIGVSCEAKSIRLKTRRVGTSVESYVEEKKHDDMDRMQWRKESTQEEGKYLRGRGVAGTGGIDIGRTLIRLRVVPLQGMRTDRLTGIRKKVFGEDEADVPIQMALWTSPVADTRFAEQDEVVSVAAMYPHSSKVVATEGPFRGCTGIVVGPHAPVQKGSDSRPRLAAGTSSSSKEQSRTVDVEFTVNPPEPPFGYALNISIMPEYVSSREASRRLGISPSVLGMLTGSFVIDPTRTDIGLNLKKNGEFQLLEYARAVVSNSGGHNGSGNGIPEPGKVGGKVSSVWGTGDTVQIVGSLDSSGNTGGVGSGPGGDGFNSSAGYSSWEYSEKAIELIEEYRRQFPIIFINLQSLSHQKKYTAKEVFGVSGSGESEVDKVITWMKNQPFFHLARSPLTTCSISRDGVRAIERAVDVRTSALASEEGIGGQLPQKVVKKKVPLQTIFKEGMFGPFDAPLEGLNDEFGPPELGDRVVNLVASAVPFGLKGTVIAIHSSSAYVEVLFDEEFAGGKSLQGMCSPFRGALVAWSSVLKVSRNTLPGQPHHKMGNSAGLAIPSGNAATQHTKGQLPPAKAKKSKDSTVPADVDGNDSKTGNDSSATLAVSDLSVAAPASDMKNITGILKRSLQPPAVTAITPDATTPPQVPSSQPTPTQTMDSSPKKVSKGPPPSSSATGASSSKKSSAGESAENKKPSAPSAPAPSSGSTPNAGESSSSSGVKNVTALFKKELNISATKTSTTPTTSSVAFGPAGAVPLTQPTASAAVRPMPPPAPTVTSEAQIAESTSNEMAGLTSKLAKAKAQMKSSMAANTITAPPAPPVAVAAESGSASKAAVPSTTVVAPPAPTPAPTPDSKKGEVASAAVSAIPGTVKEETTTVDLNLTPASAPAKKPTMLVPARVMAKKHMAKK